MSTQATPDRAASGNHPLAEVATLFLKLGFTAFGGPAAHLGMMHNEVVTRRKWLTDQQLLDLVGATNLIPGPNSTELAIHIGFQRAGWPGLIAAGACFILPAMLIVLVLAWMYQAYGTTPQAEWLLYGIKPVVIAIILQALYKLALKAVKGWVTAVAAVVAVGGYFLGANEVALLFAVGVAVAVALNIRRRAVGAISLALIPVAGAGAALAAPAAFSYAGLFLTFLKIGSVLYGSGYVLLAFLRADFVERLGWITTQQLLDAIAIGQVTPGPLFTSATFIGYLLGGLPGGVLATVGIFLPSFIFVAVVNPWIPRLRKSAWAGALLDGVNVASLGLMAAVTWQLGWSSLTDPFTIAIAAASFGLLLKFEVNSTWLIGFGALAGLGAALI